MIEQCLKCGIKLEFPEELYNECETPKIHICVNCGKPYSIKTVKRYSVIPYYGEECEDSFGNTIKD